MRRIVGRRGSIWNWFDRWCTRLDEWWAQLQTWQKGALWGGGGHILLLILTGALLGVGYLISPEYGEPFNLARRHMAELLSITGLILFRLITSIPMYSLQLLGGVLGLSSIGSDSRIYIVAWFFYILYATAIYSLLGATIAKIVGYSYSKD